MAKALYGITYASHKLSRYSKGVDEQGLGERPVSPALDLIYMQGTIVDSPDLL